MPEWFDTQSAAIAFFLLYFLPGGLWLWGRAVRSFTTAMEEQ